MLIALSLFTHISFSQGTFTLSSEDIGGQATLTEEFNGFGCVGENTSPQLTWENAPEGTQSFAVTMYDPDAPTGSGWWHWVIFDIPADVNELVSNAGPCPPEGHRIHQYIITVYALKTGKLGLDENTNPAVVGYYLWNNTIAKASIVTYYQREAK